MNTNQISNQYRDSSNTANLLVLGVSFVTLFISTNSMDPFNTPKLVSLILISSLFTGKLFFSFKTKSLLNSKVKVLAFLLIAIFLLFSLTSALFSDSLFVSFIGDTQRRNGLLAYFGLAILAVTAIQFVNFGNITNLIKISVITGSIFSFYGLLQISGRDFATWDNPHNAVIATVGNPNFASALMAVFTLLALVSLLMKSISNFFKIFAILCILMSVSAIIASNSRQGLVSLAFGVMFFLSTYLYVKRKKVGLIVITLSGLISILSIAGMLQKGPLTQFLYKASVSIRGYYWDAAVEMFKSSPIIGVGFDHYGYYFKEVRDVNYPLTYGFDITSSNAHNTFLQMFATGGLLVGLSYLTLVVVTFFVGINLVRNSKDTELIVSLGILSAWIAFQSQSVISIDNIGISVWGWLLTGSIFGLASAKDIEQNPTKIRIKSSRKNQVDVLPFAITMIFVIPSLVLSVLLMRVESNSAMARNFSDNLASQPDKSSNLSQQLIAELNKYSESVLNNNLSDPNYKIQIAYNLFNAGKFEKSIEIVKNLVEENPRNLYALDAVAILSTELNDSTSAIESRKKIIDIDPWNAKNYLQLMLLYKAIGDTQNAVLMKEKIMSFAAQTNEAKIASEEMNN
jgi:O-antigen ligase